MASSNANNFANRVKVSLSRRIFSGIALPLWTSLARGAVSPGDCPIREAREPLT